MTGGLARLLEEAAAERPGALAVRGTDGSATWAELRDQAAAVAATLHGLGAQEGATVGLVLGRTARAVAAIHGVLRAGCTCVPIDPGAPPRRAAAQLASAGARVLVAEPEHAAAVAALCAALGARVDLVGLGENPTGGAARPWGALSGYAPPPRVDPKSPAYVLYTSGSTGTPKGIAHSHESAEAFTAWAAAVTGLGPGDVVAGIAPWTFDLSTFDLYGSVAARAALVVVPRGDLLFPRALARRLAAEGVSVAYAVPTVWRGLLEVPGLSLERLRVGLFAGERFPVPALRALMRVLPQVRWTNLYGPSETNVCTWHVVDDPDPATPLPIGRLCPYATARVRGQDGQDLPAGQAGELWIGGSSRMIGYLGRPDLDRERIDAEGLYRSGDLVRQDADGVFHLLGRVDRQVKIAGHRLEIDEVEAALARLPGVREAAVAVLAGERARLGALVVPDDDSISPASLRRGLASWLPAWAIPERWVLCDMLPRTSSGKLDLIDVTARLERAPEEGA